MNLATFGCSFTSHLYPTWADILGLRFNQHVNFGQCGSGNRCIATKLFDFCLETRDPGGWLVIVMWSGFNRWDFPTGIGKWFTPGNTKFVRWRPDEKIFVDRYFNGEGEIDSQLVLMRAAQALCERIFSFNLFTSMERLNAGLDGVRTDHLEFLEKKVATASQHVIEPSLCDFVATHPERRRYRVDELSADDGHPTITQHAAYLSRILMPAIFQKTGLNLQPPSLSAADKAHAIYCAKGVRYSDYTRKCDTDEWRESMALLSS